jgi:hypothetical protein
MAADAIIADKIIYLDCGTNLISDEDIGLVQQLG